MSFKVQPNKDVCGATITDIDLTKPLTDQDRAGIRNAWLEHHVLTFPDQNMSDDDLERFTLSFGSFGDDPYIAPIAGRKHIIAVKRMADETSPIFAESWHTDWSFQATPPDGTCLFGLVIPPTGGDTLFINQHLALEQMPDALRARLEGKNAIHSARAAYAKNGGYGDGDKQARSMDIRPSDDAEATQSHPILRAHPETGRLAIFGTAGYIIGIEGMEEAEAGALLFELYKWQTRKDFQYRHKWAKNMLLMWDNRSLLHMATGGYKGHDRLLHRTTIGNGFG